MTTKRVDSNEANALLAQGYRYLDVRTEAEFQAGHVAGAANVPLNAPDFLAVMKAVFPPQSKPKLVVGCQLGGRSARACQLLEANGYGELVDHSAGWGGQRDGAGKVVLAGWAESKLPVGGGTPFAALLNQKK